MLLHFLNPACACNCPCNLREKSGPLLQFIFTSLFHPYLFTKSFLQPPPLYLIFFLHSYFWVKPSQQCAPKIFSLPQPFSQFRLPQWNTKESREDRHCFNLSLLAQSMTVITGLTTTDSFSLRFIKLILKDNEDDEDL